MAEVTHSREAVAELVRDGDTVALEGFTHLIPTGGAHEIIRQQRRDLILIRMTPDLVYDQMIGMGCAKKLVFSWSGNPDVGSLHRFRDAIEHGWPEPLEIEEHSHAGMANRYVAGASNLPFAVLRGYVGTDLPKVTKTIAPITCPFTGDELMAVPALNPDVSIIHAQQADRRGNVAIWGIVGIQKEAVMAAKRAIVTVEEVVDELEPHPFQVVLPWVAVDTMVEIWQASPAGRYDDPGDEREDLPLEQGFTGFGRSGTLDGEFSFLTLKPGSVPGPDGRSHAPHVMVFIFARGLLRSLVSRIYFPDEEEANVADPVLSSIEDPSLRNTLIAREEGGTLRFDVRLQGDEQTAFFEFAG